MLALIVLVLITNKIVLLSLGAIISFSSFVHQGSSALAKLKPIGGYANWITGFRLLLIIIGSFLFVSFSGKLILAIMLSAVILDVVDGFLARKFKQTSLFGQYFDMEVDAFFVLLMCFYYYIHGGVGWWILIPGSLRYIYRVLISLIPKPNFIEKKRKYASYIAGLFFILLVGCLIAPNNILEPFLMIGSILIVASFGISFIEFILFKKSEEILV